ncbi:hypothetical protein EV196_102247 [Mariniflexile fucanivorans]|uniref:Lipocalin-like protein n=1 Tax=Mariniflexile fucanivorans TaxID=264023 RepID=A0A4V2QEE0_9FLAO|nr:hypothetical protein [Mariniflexile fucanivorans]TCL67687.1 hypothetical protein EV196_102247 [Mariniflexile fucanivorans]
MKKIYGMFCLLILFQSCSNREEDSNDKIIGKWQVIETYQSGLLVESYECSVYLYSEFKINHEMLGGFIDYSTAPSDCTSNIQFEMLLWKKTGKNSYEIRDALNIIKSVAYFDGNNLIIETSNLPYKYVYKMLE